MLPGLSHLRDPSSPLIHNSLRSFPFHPARMMLPLSPPFSLPPLFPLPLSFFFSVASYHSPMILLFASIISSLYCRTPLARSPPPPSWPGVFSPQRLSDNESLPIVPPLPHHYPSPDRPPFFFSYYSVFSPPSSFVSLQAFLRSPAFHFCLQLPHPLFPY